MSHETPKFIGIDDMDIQELFLLNTPTQVITSASSLLASSDKDRQEHLFSNIAFVNILEQALQGLDEHRSWGVNLISGKLLIDKEIV